MVFTWSRMGVILALYSCFGPLIDTLAELEVLGPLLLELLHLGGQGLLAQQHLLALDLLGQRGQLLLPVGDLHFQFPQELLVLLLGVPGGLVFLGDALGIHHGQGRRPRPRPRRPGAATRRRTSRTSKAAHVCRGSCILLLRLPWTRLGRLIPRTRAARRNCRW